MLKFLRKRTKAIIWTVVIAFISWGGYAVSLQFEEASRSPGRISGKEVSFRDYLLANRAVQIFSPASETGNPPSPEEIEARTWAFLVLSRESKRRKINVKDEEVRQQITQGFPSPGQYVQWVHQVFREEPREFENQLREQMRIQKLLSEVQKGFPEKPEENLKRWILELIAQAKIQVYKPRS